MRDCRAVLTASGDLRTPHEVADSFDAGQCIGWVTGVLWANRLYEVMLADAKPKAPLFCAPSNATNGQAVLVLMKYLRNHPERLSEHELALTFDAFGEAWPCKAAPSK